MEKISTYSLDVVINEVINHIDEIKSYINGIKHRLSSITSEDVMYLGAKIITGLCRMGANIKCYFDLSKKTPILYNLDKNGLAEVVGRAFLGIISDDFVSSNISSIHPHYLGAKIESIIESNLYYNNLKVYETGIEKKINSELRKIYQTVGSKILEILEDRNMIKISTTKKYENHPVYIEVEVLDGAYEIIAKRENYRTNFEY